MSQAREQVIKQLIKYLETAEDWDVYEVVEWAFGFDDPAVEKLREHCEKKEGKVESKGNDPKTASLQS